MKMLTHKALRRLTLGAALAASPAFAQNAMQDMDMSHMHHQTAEPAKPDSQKKPRQGKQKPTAHAMHGMHMPSMPNMPSKPAPNLTGKLERLDIGSQIGIRPVMRGLGLKPMQMDMPGMQTQGGDMSPDARSADYSDGVGHSTMPGMHMLDNAALGMLLIDRLEYVDGHGENAVALDAQGWYGTDANKVWFKAEGEHDAGRLQDLRFEALWSHPVGIYWNMQFGVRHDFGVGPGRTWAAFGVQGLARYWFDVEATVYVGQAGRTAFRFESEYEMLITQRLILQPDFEVNVFGRDDPQRGLGAGLSDAQLGLRLRYEFTRKFAPYIGVEWERKFGNTADFARQAGEPVFDPHLVAGLRFWF